MYFMIRASSVPIGTASLSVGDMVDCAVVGANLERRNEIKSSDINVSFWARLQARQNKSMQSYTETNLSSCIMSSRLLMIV